MTVRMQIALQTADGEQQHTIEGRMAWALQQLINAGSGGCTPLTHPGPRWSDYVFKLRRAGINIETVTEKHGGPFAGHHARYVLINKVRVVHDGAEGRAAA